jgi:hypothetical protein
VRIGSVVPGDSGPGDDFVLLQDPAGDLFCVVETSGTADG